LSTWKGGYSILLACTGLYRAYGYTGRTAVRLIERSIEPTGATGPGARARAGKTMGEGGGKEMYGFRG